MSESEFHRPRRASARDTDSEKPIADDDTPVSSASAARRGRDLEASDVSGKDTVPEQTSNPQPPNPFARPGSESAGITAPNPAPLVPAPAPVLPERDVDSFGITGSGRRMAGVADGPAPEPRRSAVSSTTPPEPAAGGTPTSPPESQTWVQHNKKSLLIFVIGVLVVALVVALGSFFAGRGTAPEPATPPAPSPSPSTSVSVPPAASVDDLLTLDDANAIVDGASWDIATTAENREEATDRPACIGTDRSGVNPIDTFQRAIGTSQDDALAALHQVDLYADEESAQRVQMERVVSLSECDETQANIISASSITGLGDEVTQLTVAYQEEQAALHTVLLVRTGRALSILDVTRNDEEVPVEDAIAGLERSLGEICERVDGECPSTPEISPAVPPVVDPAGWLIIADLPRIRPGYGRWAPTDPAEITSAGMGCENLPLATEPGPIERQQRTYLLTQDDETPDGFGMDEMVFDFEDNVSARLFTEKLIENLLSCTDRRETAEVTDLGAVNGTGADGVPVSASMINIDLATGDDAAVNYQLVVAIADTRVSYLLTSVTDDYSFSSGQQARIALRVAQRNSQG
ncbi:MAG: hypothetical protein ACTHU1_02030 [Arachnia sp.]